MFAIRNHDAAQGRARLGIWPKFLALLCLTVIPSLFFLLFSLLRVQDGMLQYSMDQALSAYADSVYYAVQNHFSPIGRTVTLIEDSEEIRRSMKHAKNTAVSSADPREIEEVLRLPISYKTSFSHQAVRTVALFSGSQLQYYALSSDIDLGLKRCQQINDLCVSHPFEEGQLIRVDGSSYVYWVQDYRNIYENLYYGKIIIELYPIPTNEYDGSGDSAYSYWIDTNQFPQSQYYVLAESGAVIFSSDSAVLGRPITELYSSVLGPETANVLLGTDGEEYCAEHRRLSGALTLLVLLPRSLTTVSGGSLSPMITVILVLCYLAVLLALFRGLLAPISRVREYCQIVQEYPLTVPPLRSSCRELEALFVVLKDRIDDIQTLKQQYDAVQLQLKEAEIKSLQAQMNPHFVFNILESIGWKAAESGSNDVSAMVQRLGELMRSDLIFSNRQRITLRQEIQYTQNYLTLQQIRNAENFDYQINADPDILDSYYIPKLSLQPIAENCITHGFTDLDRKGHISIDVWEDFDGIFLRVTDNGLGFNSEGYFEKSPSSESDLKPGNHIALCNIQNRIQIIYGKNYGITIQSTPGEGTSVIVHIPFDDAGDPS